VRTVITALALGALLLYPAAGHAQEQVAKSKIVSVGVFKNGLVAVRRQLDVTQAGTYRLDKVPEAVHGTFWIESNAEIEATVANREIDVPAYKAGPLSLQEEFAGRKVTLNLKNPRTPQVVGTVLKLDRDDEDEDEGKAGEAAAARPPSRFLIVKTAKGRTYVDPSDIVTVDVEGEGDTVKVRRPVMVLTVGKSEKQPAVYMTYLTSGMFWAPSYKLDITDPKTLTLEQTAALRNEFADLDGAEVQLISGFPSIEFANVTSPLSIRGGWETFFQQLSGRATSYNPVLTNSIVVQQKAVFNARGPGEGIDLSATPSGEGVDIFYQDIGKRTLKRRSALSLKLAKEKAAYERIIEWTVPDTRDELGRAGSRTDPDTDGQAWDALRFRNPFSFPMTTAPAMVVAAGKFNGQRTSYFCNAGEENVVRVTRSLSIRTRAIENEEMKKNGSVREIVYVGGREFRKSTVRGELLVSNHRKEDVKVVIRRRFSGELVVADGTPKTSLREEGVWSVNRRYEMVWSITLRSGEERTLGYTYSVLVPN
jgi:hypothetical protein